MAGRWLTIACLIVAAVLASLLAGAVPGTAITVVGGDVQLISSAINSATGGDGRSGPAVSISDDGRFVAFESSAGNLVPGDTNGHTDIFVHDRATGAVERVSVATGGAQGDHRSEHPSISGDGRMVAFESLATNFGGDVVGAQVYVHDRQTATTTLVSSLPSAPDALDRPTGQRPSISADGTHVVYVTNSMGRGFGAGLGSFLIMIRDLGQPDSTLAGRAFDGSVPADSSVVTGASVADFPDVSATGRYVVWASTADNLVPGDTNGMRDVFHRDLVTGTTTRTSVHSDGDQVTNRTSDRPHVSGDGMRVTFWSSSTQLVDNDFNTSRDVFVHHVSTGATELVTVTPDGVAGGGQDHDISRDGSTVVFWSQGQDFVLDENINSDLYVRDLDTGRVQLASFAGDGTQPGRHVHIGGDVPAVSAGGSSVAYASRSDEILAGVTFDQYDVWAADLPELPPPNLRCRGKAVTIVGTSAGEVIEGSADDDVIAGLGGDDTIRGRGGDDTICGNGGADVLVGGGGNDEIDGGAGRDTLRGGKGADTLVGRSGADHLFGNGGADKLNGGGGGDRIKGGGGNDTLLGKGGSDHLDGQAGRDRCVGGAGSNTKRRCER